MKNTISRLLNLMIKSKSKESSLTKLTEEELPHKSAELPILSELEKDKKIFKEIQQNKSSLGFIEANHKKLELSRKYKEKSLEFLLSILRKQPSASNHSEAIQNIRDACVEVNNKYPVDWSVPTEYTPSDNVYKYRLIKHIIEVKDDGSYQIKEIKKNGLHQIIESFH